MPEPIQLPAPTQRADLLIVAGEHSGDQHAATLLKQLSSLKPGVNVCALGGEALREAGAQVIFDLVDHSVVGIAEVLKNYGFFKALFEQVVAWIQEHRPRAICFVDYPGFNLRLAERLVKEGLAAKGGGDIPLLYYISPQIWAWKGHRRFKMAKLLDSLAVIFPFEVDCYQDTDLPVKFVGHPFVASDFNLGIRYEPEAPILLLPGSRLTPVRRIFPVLIDAFIDYHAERASKRAVALYPSPAVKQLLEELIATRHKADQLIELRPAEADIAASATLTSSGTMSLKVALAGIPGRIVYRANPITYVMGRMLVKIPYLGISNILLDRPAYPEYLQGAAKPAVLARELAKLTDGAAAAESARQDARELRQLLGEGQDNAAAAWLAEFL
ncbi:lipid-A-disaccharide synthase [Cerasicoccus fimbriatus]|uniref:lipid-A-disaccharide synthase n=1 Tax=Cerasicoccus fimbriatus TaxID=3014554 RepID=UPI0022B44DDE|nr:lipid-A-disaccharide synthase [Cerasicoccus sp. TK19100]